MPPSHHSSSSHSSHSSSHSSSSRSSSSRSYSSSSSSRSYSSRSSSSGGSSRGPSRHSSSSHSSRSYSPPPSRPRVNQPTGYKPTGSSQRPRHVYGRRHDYVYYPTPWVDSSTGTSYEKGYYDENGNRYDDVAFSKNGVYENVLCHCPYCGQDAVMDLSAKDVGVKQLQCPSCGGPVEIRSMLDDAVRGPSASGGVTRQAAPKKRGRGCLITTIISVVILAILAVFGSQLPSDGGGQDTLALVQTGAHSYRVAESGEAADLTLGWDRDSESYYDPGSECWVWYNTDVSPNVWQYWVEGISSDYGDYGWMEHDETGWYIEADQGVWTEVPAWYDTSGLWYFD